MSKYLLALLLVFPSRYLWAANPIDALKPGEWYEVPNSKLAAVAPNPLPPGSLAAEVTAWSGGAFDTKRNQFLVWGGGHGDYAGNEVYAFNVDSLKWARLTNPSTDVGGDESSGLYPDGNPRARHTYNYIQYVPSIDRFCTLGGAGLYPSGQTGTNKVQCLNLDTRKWETKANTMNASIGNITGIDAATGLLWMESTGQYSYLSSWNPAADVWTKRANFDPTWFPVYSTGAVGNHHFLALGNGKLWDWDLNSPLNQPQTLATTGGDAVVGANCPGFQYHPASGTFIAWAGGKNVYALNPATKAWSLLAIASTNSVTPSNPPVNGTFGRFQYVPSKNAFLCYNSVTEDVFIFKYGAATAQPPVTPPANPPVVVTPPATTPTSPVYVHDTTKVFIRDIIRIIPRILYDTLVSHDTSSFTFITPNPAPVTGPIAVTPPPATPPVVVPPPATTPTGARLLTTVKIRNAGAAPQGSLPVTFGQVLKPGDVKPGETLKAYLGGVEIASQFDLKAKHNDGSARHGVMSFLIDSLGANQEAAVQLMAAPQAPPAPALAKSQLPADFDAKLSIKIKGVNYSLALKSLINSAAPSISWLSGSLVNEFIVSGPLKDSAANPEPHLNAIFAVRQYRKNVRVDLTLENAWTYDANPQGYVFDVNYTVGSAPALAANGVKMPHQTRWRLVSWFKNDINTALTFDKKYLMSTGAFPYYDISLPIPEAQLAAFKTTFPPMSIGNINAYMPTTGAADGIGPLPMWSAAYLISMDDRARRNVLANGEAAGSFGIHYRDRKTGYPVSIDDYPYFTQLGSLSDSYNPATGKYEMPPAASDTLNTLTPDDAHQPSLAFVPYAVSGDYFFLEELQYWADWNMLIANPGYRNYKDGLLDHTQTRAKAWSLRTLAHAAYITPDAHPLKAYFAAKLGNNIAWFNSQYVNGPKDNHIGYYDDNAYAPYGFAPWQDNFLTFSIGYVNQLGFSQAKPFLDFKAKLSTSMLTDSAYCWLDASAYSLQHSTAAGARYKTIAEIYRGNFPAATGCSGTVMDGYPSGATGYGADLQPALAVAVDNNEPNSLIAWNKYQTRNPKQYYNEAPQFDIIPKSVLDPMLQ